MLLYIHYAAPLHLTACQSHCIYSNISELYCGIAIFFQGSSQWQTLQNYPQLQFQNAAGRCKMQVDFCVAGCRSMSQGLWSLIPSALFRGPEICHEATRYLSATRGNHQKALSLMEATENWRRHYFKETIRDNAIEYFDCNEVWFWEYRPTRPSNDKPNQIPFQV